MTHAHWRIFSPQFDWPNLYYVQTGCLSGQIIRQAPVVQKMDSAIHRINLYPVDSAIGFPNTYPLDRDLSDG